ncbi:hypothetical protein O181_104197 [Austropuccinia psidii MF-1]|uniref:Uncharacterized protein n=1 Tax=Austropuccinia psidii MF-1 TaxID=1389203 RepID=A0A9Q3JMK7_9BASI|nr:hypothetical protein [Austropuccinia psidii MF-1]
MGDGLTAGFKEGLVWEEFGDAGGMEVGMVARVGWKFLGLLGMMCIWNLLAGGWEVEVLDGRPAELETTSTSSPSNSSLPSASASGGELAIHHICFTMPSVLILEIGTSELEYIGLPPPGMGPPTLVNMATSLFLEPVTES